MSRRLANLVAVVTGAAGGIGAALARAAAAEGASVACLDLDGQGAQRIATSLIDDGADAMAVHVDLVSFSAVEEALATVTTRWPRVHALFANAGGSRGEQVPFLDMDSSSWDHMMDRNLRTAFNSGRVFARHMADRHMADQGGGAIVYTSSQLSLVTRPGLAHYAAAKGGVAQLVKGMAVDLAPHGIRVNAVAPGPTQTPGNSAWFATADAQAEHQRLIPMGRVAQPSEIVGAAIYLASNEASFTTGATIVVDGGYTIL